MKCFECGDTGLNHVGVACDKCNVFDKLYTACGNCDIPPAWADPADCCVCHGRAYVRIDGADIPHFRVYVAGKIVLQSRYPKEAVEVLKSELADVKNVDQTVMLVALPEK